MQVFKFGGASVRDAAAVRNVATIIQQYGELPLLVVVSAMGKMTNAFEELVERYFRQDGSAKEQYQKIQEYHWKIAQELFPPEHPVFALLNDVFVEAEWVLETKPQDTFDYVYDQIVSLGEMLSTRIVSAHLVDVGIDNQWVDARDLIITGESYREGRVDWEETRKRIATGLPETLRERIVLTQGFIAGTRQNTTTTLGREGSDFSAAIFANCLDADSMTIWKDVPGVLSADPKVFDNVQHIARLDFREATEMTYYGAKVIHPKTIKPLQNKQIPLWVRSFENPDQPGTLIGTDFDNLLPPIIVLENNQAILQIATKDFSFVAEHHLSHIFSLFAEARMKINLMRNTAISFTVCVGYHPEKIAYFINSLGDDFQTVVDTGLELITIRHYSQSVIDQFTRDVRVVLEERFENTIQLVVKRAGEPKLKQ